MDPMPLAGSFPKTRGEALGAPTYPLTWLQCRACGLVNVEPDIDDDVIYSTYSYASSDVPGLVRHHAGLAEYIVARADGQRLLEIGCNDGVLLNQLPATWHLVGVDPSDVARQGQGEWDLINEPFTSRLAASLGTFDVVTSSNSFAHFKGIADALDGIADVLRTDGLFIIEVHDLAATLRHATWDTIYHEHCVEWSSTSLQAVIEPLGFRLLEMRHLPLHGGLLRATFRRVARPGVRPPIPRYNFRPLQVAYQKRRPPRLPWGTVAYGAAARASVYLNQLPALEVPYIIDGSPLRYGRYMAGRGIKVVPPSTLDEYEPPAILITAWNHADDIVDRHPDYPGQWITAWNQP
jgi:SAM-dependent methyltransferase